MISAFDLACIFIGATAVTAAVAFAFWGARRRELVTASREEVTPVARPVLNAANRPLVEVLLTVATSVELSGHAVADGLRDIAKTIRLFESTPVGDVLRERIARVVDEHGSAVKRGAIEIREAKENA